MTIKMYVSSICGNKEMKKHQMKAQLIMESKGIDYLIVDIADPIQEDDKKFMQENAKPRTGKYPLPPQFFNETVWCGDYESFDEANETDTLEEFLKLPAGSLNQNILKRATTTDESSPAQPVSNGDSRLSEEPNVPADDGEVEQVLRDTSVEPAEVTSSPTGHQEEVPATDQREDDEEEEEDSEEEDEEE